MNDPTRLDDEAVELLVGQVADEFTQRAGRGENPLIEEYAQRHPDIADVLREVLPALQVMGPLGLDSLSSPLMAQSGAGARRCLGDYQILREVGRGGMGIVYEAEQVSLERRVALKVLPFAAALDDKRLQRFKLEAQAAAHLHHTNIVPIYAVGAERGVHYYAMQFIDGQTVAALIADLRQHAGLDDVRATVAKKRTFDDEPSAPNPQGVDTQPANILSTERSIASPAFFRNVANLGFQAAEGLEHAHQQGIVHRDIKPANLIVDEHGNLWITDFGLARIQSDAALTLSGDMLGTLRYMSPEQALAKPLLVDQRTDLYSLGATLYEMLTLQPAFAGRDRQELLKQIAFDEPTEPRRMNSAIPVELETIVGKAMAKSPEDRYGSAQDLADDLRRYLDDQPIHARRPTPVQRLKRWTRRHKAVVMAVAVSSVLMLAGSLGFIVREHAKTQSALQAALIQEEIAERRRVEAEQNLRLARDVVDKLLTQFGEERLAHVPQMEKARRTLLEDARRFYEKLMQERDADPSVRQETAKAYRRVGDISHLLGEYEQAEESYRSGLVLQQALIAAHPDRPEYRHELARASLASSALFAATGRPNEAEQNAARATEEMQRLVSEFPTRRDYLLTLADSHLRLGDTRRSAGRHKDSIAMYQKDLEVYKGFFKENSTEPAMKHRLAACYVGLAMSFANSENAVEADRNCQEALSLREELVADFPHTPEYRRFLALCLTGYGSLFATTAPYQKAEQLHFRSITILESLSKDFPNVPSYQRDTATCFENLGNMYRNYGQIAPAERQYRKAIEIFERLTKNHPAGPDFRHGLAVNEEYVARLCYSQRRFEDADNHYQRAIAELRKLIVIYPNSAHYRNSFAINHEYLGDLRIAAGKTPEGEVAYNTAMAMLQSLVQELPTNIGYRNALAVNKYKLGRVHSHRGTAKDAESLFDQALELFHGLIDDIPETIAHRRSASLVYEYKGYLLRQQERFAEAADCFGKSLELVKFLAKDHPTNEEYASALAINQESLGLAKQAAGDVAAARPTLVQALSYRKDLLNNFANASADRRADYERKLGALLKVLGREAEAVSAYERANRISPEGARDHNARAWFLATCDDLRLRDSAKAVLEAEQATRLAPDVATYWNTLGAAQYRTARWQDAVRTFGKSMQMREGGDSFDWFFLAMTEWRLGHVDEALTWYKQAVAWMDKHRPDDQELRRFRSEAATLLGVAK